MGPAFAKRRQSVVHEWDNRAFRKRKVHLISSIRAVSQSSASERNYHFDATRPSFFLHSSEVCADAVGAILVKLTIKVRECYHVRVLRRLSYYEEDGVPPAPRFQHKGSSVTKY